jgi:predicted dinucleotide-binding enzyme
MTIGLIGAGRIGGNVAGQAVRAGHEVKLSFSRDVSTLDALARDLGDRASTGTPADAVAFGEVVVLSVPWGVISEALEKAGDLSARVVIDTTNQFGSGPMPPPGQTAASFNARRMPGARYMGSFNTLTARFHEQTAERVSDERVVQWICGDEPRQRSS